MALYTPERRHFDALEENDRFCPICHGPFYLDESIAIIGCCNVQHHIRCTVNWLIMPAPAQEFGLPQYATCTRCTARWSARIFHDVSLLRRMDLNNQVKLGPRIMYGVEAGVPPADCSLTEAVKFYGRTGLMVLLREMVGVGYGPVEEGEAQRLLDTTVERLCKRMQEDRRTQDLV